MKKYDIGTSVVLFILSGMIFYSTKDMPPVLNEAPGPGFWPNCIAVMMIALGAALLIKTLVSKNQKKEQPIAYHTPGFKRVCILFLIFIAFSIVLKYLGFIIAALLFVPAVMFALGEKRPRWLILTSVGTTAFVYVVFAVILRLDLPQPFFL